MGKYTLLGTTIEFKECNERFFDIQYRVWKAMDAASSEFNKWYDSCGDILTVLKGYEKKATREIELGDTLILFGAEDAGNIAPVLGGAFGFAHSAQCLLQLGEYQLPFVRS